MPGADVTVVPSLWEEAFGLIIIESMAAGVPVIASNVGGIPDIIAHEKNGILVPRGDAEELASAIKKIIDKRGKEYKGRLEDSKRKIKYTRFLEFNRKRYKPYFGLHPPTGGFEKAGIKQPLSKGGALGYRKQFFKLIERML